MRNNNNDNNNNNNNIILNDININNNSRHTQQKRLGLALSLSKKDWNGQQLSRIEWGFTWFQYVYQRIFCCFLSFSSCFIVESIWDWGNDIIRGDGGLSTFLLLWPVDASLTGLSNLDSEEFPYSCGNSKFNTTSLKVLSTISDLFVLYLQPACEEIFVQSVATGYSAAKNISPASKRGHCVYMMLHQQGNKLDSSVEASVKIKKGTEEIQRVCLFISICQKCRKPKKQNRKWNWGCRLGTAHAPGMFKFLRCSTHVPRQNFWGQAHSIFLVRAFQTTWWPNEVKVQKDLNGRNELETSSKESLRFT